VTLKNIPTLKSSIYQSINQSGIFKVACKQLLQSQLTRVSQLYVQIREREQMSLQTPAEDVQGWH